MSTPRNLMLFAVLAALPAPSAQDPQPPITAPVMQVDGGAAVEIAIDGVSIANFLAAAQPILGVPMQSLPDEVSAPRLHQTGVQRVARWAFRDAFDAVLRREGFWSWDDMAGGAPVIVVRRVWPGRRDIPFTPPVIGLDELESGPRIRAPLYTTTFLLQNVPARDMLVVGMSCMDSSMETMRHFENINQLQVTASREHLLALRDALAQVDVPGSQSPGLDVQVAGLMQRVADMEQRLATLEKKAGG